MQSPLHFLFELDKNIASNWDLYLITILTILLGMIFYFRRPPQQNERDHPRSQETTANSMNANANASTNNATSTTAPTITTSTAVTNNSGGNSSAVNPSLSPPPSSSSSPSQSSPQSPATTGAVNSDQ